MTPHTRVAVRIPVTLKHQLAALARHRRVAMTDLVEAALHMLLDADPAPPSVAQRLEQLVRDVRALHRAQAILEETLGLFINVYFTTTPEVPSEQEEAARQRGGRRYARFMRVLEGKLAQAGRGKTTGEGGDHDAATTPDRAGPRA